MSIWKILLEIAIAWFYAHVAEYCLHRWVLHNIKSFKGKWFKTHFADHHGICRKLLMVDPLYFSFKSIIRHPEVHALFFLILIHLPLAWIFPFAYGTIVYSGVSYYIIHRRAHVDAVWGRRKLPWHYDHHMASDQHMNWGVRLPFIDNLVGTRKEYKGTLKETDEMIKRIRDVYDKIGPRRT